MLKKIVDVKLEEIFLAVTMVAMVLLIFTQVVSRYVFGSSLSWSEELARYIHIWQIWIGASFAIRMQEHVRVDAFLNLVGGVARKALETLSILVWFVLAVFLAVTGMELVSVLYSSGQSSPAMQFPVWVIYSAIPVGGVLMTLRLIQQLYFLYRPSQQ